MGKTGGIPGVRRVRPALCVCLFLSACASLPKEVSEAAASPQAQAGAFYRDLADIPAPPVIATPQANGTTSESLIADRAKTAQAAEDLRLKPFDQPDPAMKLEF